MVPFRRRPGFLSTSQKNRLPGFVLDDKPASAASGPPNRPAGGFGGASVGKMLNDLPTGRLVGSAFDVAEPV